METKSESDELYQLHTENRHLKDTIIALRQELENLRIENEQNLQKALSDSHSEIAQLKETTTALRDEMEKMEIESEPSPNYLLNFLLPIPA